MRRYLLQARPRAALLLLALLLAMPGAAFGKRKKKRRRGALPPSAPARVDYLRDVKPLLAARCYACHSSVSRRGGLRLDTAALLLKGGDSGPAVVPRRADRSLLLA